MTIQQSTAAILTLTVAIALCFPPATWAQNPGTSPSPAPAASAVPVSQSNAQDATSSSQQNRQQTTVTPQASGTTVNPSQPPLQPVTTYPDAAGNPQKEVDAGTQAPTGQPQTQTPQTEPQGAATAEKVPTAGGAAAKPAGAAIAPAKQHQARSLLIKLGAVAAGAVAAGTVYALSRGTPSVPPGAGSPGAVQKR